MEPYLAYDAAGELVGIRWPSPDASPRSPGLCLSKRLGGGGASSAEGEDSPPPGVTIRFFELSSSLEFHEGIEFQVDAEHHRAVIRLKTPVLKNLREALKKFDQNPYHSDSEGAFVSDPWKSGKDDLLRPAIPKKRP